MVEHAVSDGSSRTPRAFMPRWTFSGQESLWGGEQRRGWVPEGSWCGWEELRQSAGASAYSATEEAALWVPLATGPNNSSHPTGQPWSSIQLPNLEPGALPSSCPLWASLPGLHYPPSACWPVRHPILPPSTDRETQLSLLAQLLSCQSTPDAPICNHPTRSPPVTLFHPFP